MSRGWKTDSGKNIYFIKVKVARTIDNRLQLSNTLSEFSLIQLGCFTILRHYPCGSFFRKVGV